MSNKLLTISDIRNIKNSYISILARFKNDISKHVIVYNDHIDEKLIQLYDNDFANLYTQLILDFELGFTIGAIVGIARERTPADKWHSDTIERSMQDKNSMHQGILRIINKEDGIPVYIPSTQTIGNIAPALAYHQRGNPIEIRKALNKYNFVQKQIMAKILEGKPSEPIGWSTRMYSAGEGFKSENRLISINRALEKSLTHSKKS